MKLIKKVVFVLLAIILTMAIVAFLLSGRQSAQRSRDMAAPPEKLWPLISDPRQWPKWAAWNQRDPNMKITYEGADSGAGAKWHWESKSEGNGSMVFDSAEPNKQLSYTIAFPDMGSTAKGTIALEPAGSGTKVSWSFETELGNNPMMRWFGLMIPNMVGKDFDTGLENLDRLAK